MKYILIIILMHYSSLFAQNNNVPVSFSEQIKYSEKNTYALSQDSVEASLDVIIYSRTVIKYSLSINSPNTTIEQNGYALNLADSNLEGGFEYESDENGKELRVIPYQNWYCCCEQDFNIEIRIALDGSKISIFSSQELRSKLLNEQVTNPECLNCIVPLISYLYRKSSN